VQPLKEAPRRRGRVRPGPRGHAVAATALPFAARRSSGAARAPSSPICTRRERAGPRRASIVAGRPARRLPAIVASQQAP
jgi:hypothetical protein